MQLEIVDVIPGESVVNIKTAIGDILVPVNNASFGLEEGHTITVESSGRITTPFGTTFQIKEE